jgi:hypothetical protein
VDVHWIRLQGAAVAQDVRIPLAPRRGSTGSVNQIQLLDNGDAIAAIAELAAPFDPMTPVAGVASALAVDRAGRTAYIAVAQAVYAVPIPAGGAPVLLGWLIGGANGLDVDADGNLIAAVVDTLQGKSLIVRVDLGTWTSTVLGTTPNNHNGLVYERATGFFVYATNGLSATPACYWMDAAGRSTVLATSLPGVPSSVSIRHDPQPYGRPTPGSSRYAWQAWPSPGGLPQIGNAGFGLHVEAVPGPGGPGVVLAAAAEGYAVVLGAEVWLAPATLVSFGGILPGRTLALPLPAIPTLIGQSVFFQSVHPDPGAPAGLAATEGLRVTLLR